MERIGVEFLIEAKWLLLACLSGAIPHCRENGSAGTDWQPLRTKWPRLDNGLLASDKRNMIELERVFIHAGDFHLRDVSFVVPSGQYAVLMGRTGSGKTTILETILGLRRIAAGTVKLNGQDVTDWRPAVRGVGYVPQDGALFRTMTVRDQIGLGLVIRKVPQPNVRRRVDELAHWLGIAHLLQRKPHGLSGGERQRVALGRALSFRPRILCLDEPLSALDDDTRTEMVALLKRVQKEAGVTALHVTHHVGEAEQLADVRLHLHEGRVDVSNGKPGKAST